MSKLLLLPILLLLAGQVGSPPASPPARAKPAAASWDRHYAQARLTLAEAGLRRVEQMNQRVANATSATVVAEYRDEVVLARARLLAAQRGEPIDAFAFWIARAEAVSRSAQAQAAGAAAANRAMPDTIKPLDMARLQGQADVSKLLAERARQLAQRPPSEQLSWQLEFLQVESERLHEEQFRIGRSSGISPLWPY